LIRKSKPLRGSLWVRKIVRRLERLHGERSEPKKIEPLETLILGTLAHRASLRRARRAYRRLAREFVDLNEVRVSALGEIGSVIRDADPYHDKAAVLRRALDAVFKQAHSISFDFLREMKASEAEKFLKSVEGLDAKTISDLMLAVKRPYSIPMDCDLLRCVRRIGLVDRDSTDVEAHKRLTSIVPKGLAYPFTQLVVEHAQVQCTDKNPDCSECAICNLCVTCRQSGRALRTPRDERARRSRGQGK